MFSIDISVEDPKHQRLLQEKDASKRQNSGYVSQFQDSVIDFLLDEPDSILLQVDFDIPQQPTVYKVNVYTGKKTALKKAN
jgi:hypothetical protein